MIILELILWAAQIVIIPYLIYRREWERLGTPVIIFFMLLIPIVIGLNTPNPDNVQLIQVTIP